MENLIPSSDANVEQEKKPDAVASVLQFEGRYKGTEIILAAAMLNTDVTPAEVDPRWFTLLFIGSDDVRKLGKRLLDMKEGEEFMFYVENPEMPKGSV